MLKRILRITRRDFISSVREFILIYIMIAPLLLAWGLTFFVPSVETTTMIFAVDKTVPDQTVQALERYGQVERFETREALEKRLAAIDEVFGVIQNGERHEILLYGDEREGADAILQVVLAEIEHGAKGNMEITFTDDGFQESPVALVGTVSLVLMALALGGGVIGLNIVEEKEDGTIRALTVSPMRRLEFVVGKALTGLVLAFVQIAGIMTIVGYMHVDLLQLVWMTAVSLILLVLSGFLIGVVSPNQIAALANMKFSFLPIGVSVIVAVAAPVQYHFLLYWSPFYWSYMGYVDIINQVATWSSLLYQSAWIVGISGILVVATAGRIRKGLA